MKRKRSILRLFILSAIYFLVANFAHPVEPTFYKLLELPDYMFGVAFAAMATTVFLFSPFWGKMSDRIGPCNVQVICYIGYAIGQLYFFFLAKGIVHVVLARLLAGVFIGGIGVANILYIIENTEGEHKGGPLATYATLSAVFSAFGYLIGGVVGDLSLKGCLAAEVIGLFLLSLLVYLFMEDKPREETKIDVREVMKEANPLKAFAIPREDLSIAFFAFLMVCMFTSFASTCYEQCFNYFIKDQYGFPPSYNGYLKGGVGIITLIANSTICSYLLNRTEIRKSITYVFMLCLIMMWGIIVIEEVRPFIILNVVFFAFNAVYKPLLQSMLNGFSKKSSGSIVGIYNSMTNIGTIVGSLTSGFVYAVSPKGSFFYAAIAFGFAIIFSIIQRFNDKNTNRIIEK